MNKFMFDVERFFDILIDKGGYKEVIEGLLNTMIIAVGGLLIGAVIGTLIATVRVMPKYKAAVRAMDKICGFYVGFFRGTPMVVQLLVFYFVLLPLLGIKLASVPVAIAVFGLNSGAYISEIMRGGILSVDPGQMEGGRSVGLSYGTTMIKVVIPQAVKNILPTMGNEFVALIKETSVVSFIGAKDLYLAFQNIGNATYAYMVPYLSMAIIYIIIVCIITVLIKIMERRLSRSDRGR
ncbi:MAG: amino acid ABC transporter permease [Acutalibacteraceae bacterium]|nr:amino acid ABC transporter permease [Acutalibacteraceae bacterium]